MRRIGFKRFAGGGYNERANLSLGFVHPDIKEGDVLTMIWGEPKGGSTKTTVELHEQCEIRVKVSSVLYSRDAPESYADSWRTPGA